MCMSAQTQVYLFNQRTNVVLLTSGGSTATRRYQIVYAKTLQITRGVSNVLEFAFINTNQKPVNLLNQQFVFRIINYNDSTILLEKPLDPIPHTNLTDKSDEAADSK